MTQVFIKNLNLSKLQHDFCREFTGVNSNAHIEELIISIVKETNLKKDDIELTFRGEELLREKSLNDYIHNANMAILYLIEKTKYPANLPKTPNEKDTQELCNKLASILKSKRKRRILESFIKDQKNLDNIYKAIPGIEEEFAAYSYVQSYELLTQFADVNNGKKIISAYPMLYYSLSELIKLLTTQINSAKTDTNFVSKSAYSINDLSEDEDEAAAQQQRRQQRPAGGAQAAPQSALTRDFFSSVLASVNQQQQQPQGQTNRDFFQNAFQQAINQTVSANRDLPQAPQQPQTAQTGLSDEDIATKLDKMHECGLLDDERNLRALQLAEGNVEAAVALLFEGMEFE